MVIMSRNPFYSGLLFDSFARKEENISVINRSRNPFYSGLLFDSAVEWIGGFNPFDSMFKFFIQAAAGIISPIEPMFARRFNEGVGS